MQNVRKIWVMVAALVVILAIVYLLLPSEVRVVRTLKIDAPVEQVFPMVNRLENWQDWLPWSEQDSGMDVTYWEIREGEGAGMCWISRSKIIGNGCSSIIESISNQSLTTFIDLTIEGKGTAHGYWLFEPIEKDQEDVSSNDGVYVTWTVERDVTHRLLIGKFAGLFLADKLGPYLEEGLLNLKEKAERSMSTKSADIRIIELNPQRILSIRDSCRIDGIGEKLRELYTELNVFMSLDNIEYGGQPLTIYHRWEPDDNFTVIEAAIPVLREKVKTSGRIRFGQLNEGPAAMSIHHGLFSESDVTHRAIEAWISESGKKIDGSPWEVYVTDPSVERDTGKWETKVYYPISDH